MSITKEDNQPIVEYVKENPFVLTYRELAQKFKRTRDSVQGIIRRAQLTHLIVKEGGSSLTQEADMKKQTLADVRKASSEREARRTDSKTLKEALKKIDALEREKEALFVLKKPAQTFAIKPSKEGQHRAVPVIVASDWHVEETVTLGQVNGMNEYNPEVAEARAKMFFASTLRLLDIYGEKSHIDTAVLALLGDFISNTIHDELAEGNAMLPGDAIWFAKSLLYSGIKFLLENTQLDFVIVCHTGNHGRMTKKVHISTEAGNSLERYMYRHLAEMFKDEKRVKFIIPEGMISYHNVLGTTIRFLHGHSIRYQGGVGGIHIPVRKAIAQWDRVHKADITVLGHFHQAMWGGHYVVNGSLIGYNAFGEFIKADFEPPRQMFFLIHEGRGVTGANYVWLD